MYNIESNLRKIVCLPWCSTLEFVWIIFLYQLYLTSVQNDGRLCAKKWASIFLLLITRNMFNLILANAVQLLDGCCKLWYKILVLGPSVALKDYLSVYGTHGPQPILQLKDQIIHAVNRLRNLTKLWLALWGLGRIH